jgi:DNA-binding XRE family transcriptional regulator
VTGGFTKDPGNEVFGRLIAVRRAALGLSQEALAARMETSKRNVAGIENGVPPRLEMLERLGAALAPEPATHPAWRSLGGRWRWGVLAIAVLVPALVILNGQAGEGGGGASAERLPRAESPAPTDPAPVVRVYTRAKPGSEIQRVGQAQRRTAHSTTGAGPRQGQSPGTGGSHWGSAPETTLRPTSPATPAPPPSGAAPPQPSGSGSPSAPLNPTGKPEGTPGNGPGGGESGGGNGTGAGNGPGGTGPPGQIR